MRTLITVATILFGFGLYSQNLKFNNQVEGILKETRNQFFDLNTERYSYRFFKEIVTVGQQSNRLLDDNELEFTTNEYIYADTTFGFKKIILTPAVRFDFFRNNSASSLLIDPLLISNNITIGKLDALYTITEKLNFFVRSAVGSQNSYVGIEEIGKMNYSYAIDIGLQWNLFNKVSLGTTLWLFSLDEGFVYVDEEGLIEANGEEQRVGVDMDITYQINDWLSFNSDFFYANSKSKDESVNYEFVSEGGITIDTLKRFSGGIGYRYSNTSVADNSTANVSYLAADLNINYNWNGFTFGIAIENIFDASWGEPELATASRLTDRPVVVNGSNFVPDDTMFIQAGISYNF